MVSQFGSLGYTIMGKTADLTAVQKTVIDTLYKEGKPQTFIAKEAGCSQSAVSSMLTESWVGGNKCEEKDAKPTRENRSLMRIVKQNRFKNLMNFTRNGLRLGSRHQEPPNRRVKEFGYSYRQRRLPGLRRRRTGLLPSGPNSSFQMRASFVFHLETKVLESGGRVEKLIAQVAWSSVLSFQSVMIWGAMSSAGVGPLCFLKTKVTAPVYQEILEHFMLPSSEQLFKDADFIFQQDLAPAHTAKAPKVS